MKDLRATFGLPAALKSKVNLWLEQDQNADTSLEIKQLITSENWPELHKRLDNRISFGTAGLRARMEAGFSRMNLLTVLQASQGLAAYIKEQFPIDASVVIGHDHRYHSKEFAEITAAAFIQLGIKVLYLCWSSDENENRLVHTPMVPFSIGLFGASAGVMITASHNPKDDNGYKVYYSNGCQIIPPHDKLIADKILSNLEPRTGIWDYQKIIQEAHTAGKLSDVRQQAQSAYMERLASKLLYERVVPGTGKPWFVYTPMHGVGSSIFEQATQSALGLREGQDFLTVEAQKIPDPSFPTVSFPNPEEKGALDMALDLAKKKGISLVIANDPDADRFSAAVLNGHEWHQLSGNELGFLFTFFLWEVQQQSISVTSKPFCVLNSTVSSQMIKSMAQMEGFHYEETLTGFKWLGNRSRQLEEQGYFVSFAFEEAIGFMFPSIENDKDGISAALVFLQMYSHYLKKGKTPLDMLKIGFQKYGVFKEYNGYYVVPEPAATDKVFADIRASFVSADGTYCQNLGTEFAVTYYRDLTTGFQSDTSNFVPVLPVDPSSQMLTLVVVPTRKSSDGSETVRFTIRGSGTEPKLKVYIEAQSDTAQNASHLAKLLWDVLRREWFRPEVNGLTTQF
ncbi:LAMI_0G01442g1_1 [Lachancea mirantina]|uniref:LAMI_0G01442g1_1 n=1 Tax=Lachancea mirantina TaxID=1230905 RepID=A0A1G4K7F2_9SACH|nr:LAMI_0G01442g1_1 [Lachancea mirantina]